MKFIICISFIFSFIFSFDKFDLKSIKAEFIQTIKSEDGIIKYSGKLIATANQKAYWEYIKPIEKEIFINKNEAIIYEPNLNQAIISKKINVDFIKIINSIKENENGLISEVNGIIFEISLKNNKPHKINYIDELDNEIEIILNNIELNKNIDDKVFIFSIPKDADVILE